MKNGYLFILIVVLFLSSCARMQDSYIVDIQAERDAKDSLYSLIKESPFGEEQLTTFKGLNYFPIDEKYKLEARIEILSQEEVVQLQTSTDRMPDYLRYAFVYFTIDKKEYKLTAFKSVDSKDKEYENFLFLPFTDNNSTNDVYGGGRYVDFEIPTSKIFILDFNKAYNPYCAYNHKWSCVIPPRENALNVAINAGEKKYFTNRNLSGH